jgi:hypothetical protein
MKKYLLITVAVFYLQHAAGQITTPQIQAGFGIDADLKANFFNASILSGNDDWFNDGTPGPGIFVIDTTGASAIFSGYSNNPGSLNQTIIRTMGYAPFSFVNNKMLIDAVFVRDFHGDDSTVFASGSNKNGMIPSDWSTPISQSVPDKNEILDVFMHVRRDGIGDTDSLWMFGGISIENTTGNRYFDFEMFQTDIVYNRATQTFTGYGPDAGHTSWKFDALGNVTQPGDIIFTAEYSSSELSLVEARIWIDKDDMTNVTPGTFSWGGLFDGDGNGAQYGYASIVPSTAGAFYSGMQCDDNTWGGPFGIVLGDNTIHTDYEARQLMEFGVNLTKLGLDPVTLLGGSTCRMPFRRVMVKTRASTSFTSELKDFVAPFDFLSVAKAEVNADIPLFCGVISVSNIKVNNAVPSSLYQWTTADGHFADSSDPTSVYVDAPGTYIVTQQLRSVCPVYASDTIFIDFDPFCGILANGLLHFSGKVEGQKAVLNWTVAQNNQVQYFDVERSTDGITYTSVARIYPKKNNDYSIADDVQLLAAGDICYRLKITSTKNNVQHSDAIRLLLKGSNSSPVVAISPNPVRDKMKITINSNENKKVLVNIYDAAGRPMRSINTIAARGAACVDITGLESWQQGIYTVKVMLGNEAFTQKMILTK